MAEFQPASLRSRAQEVNTVKGRLEGGYHVAPGPSEPSGVSFGASRKWGASLKLGEGTGGVGLALIHNLRPELQIQAGGSYLGGYEGSFAWVRDFRIGSYFALLRKYEGVYFIDGGLNLKSTEISLREGGATYAKTGWEAGIPVHVGVELGPRRSVFATLSLGYLWIFTGGGDVLEVRTPGGRFDHTFTDDSGPSFGLALGMYLF